MDQEQKPRYITGEEMAAELATDTQVTEDELAALWAFVLHGIREEIYGARLTWKAQRALRKLEKQLGIQQFGKPDLR